MPTMDPGRSRLRIGRWVPPYVSPPGDVSGRRTTGRPQPAPVQPPLGTGLRRTGRAPAGRTRLAIGLSALLAAAALVAVVAARPGKTPLPPVAGALGDLPPAGDPGPALPVPVLPAPSISVATSASRPAPPSRTTTAAHHDRGARRPAPATAARPDPGWQPGRTVSLEPVGSPGYRLRHRDFRARVDRIGPASRPLDRADATFTVRAGLADAACVSLEAVNYPGRFLRHRDFVLRLQPRDGSALFAADATFCPVSSGPGPARALRSVNYPDRHLVVGHSQVLLRVGPAGAATAFLVEPPL